MARLGPFNPYIIILLYYNIIKFWNIFGRTASATATATQTCHLFRQAPLFPVSVGIFFIFVNIIEISVKKKNLNYFLKHTISHCITTTTETKISIFKLPCITGLIGLTKDWIKVNFAFDFNFDRLFISRLKQKMKRRQKYTWD